jgi:hypothetical protein
MGLFNNLVMFDQHKKQNSMQSVQQAMPERNTGVAADSRIELRIGINLGDVIVVGDDLYGDGVNIAARIEAWPIPAGCSSPIRSMITCATGCLSCLRIWASSRSKTLPGRSTGFATPEPPLKRRCHCPGNPLLGGIQATGNSNAIRDMAAAAPSRCDRANDVVSAAAQRWNVDPASCPAQSGEVLHPPTGRRVKYGDLAADAAWRCPKAWRSTGRRISSSSARRPSVLTRRQRSTEGPSMALTCGRRA